MAKNEDTIKVFKPFDQFRIPPPRYKEERRRQLALQVATRLSSAASSSEEEGDKVSYAEFRRRRRRREPEARASLQHLPQEHVYQSIGSVGSLPSVVGREERGLGGSMRRQEGRGRRQGREDGGGQVLRSASLRCLGREERMERLGRRSLLNTSYSSEEVLASTGRRYWG